MATATAGASRDVPRRKAGISGGNPLGGFPLREQGTGLGYNLPNLNRSGLGGRSPFERSLPVMLRELARRLAEARAAV